MTENDNNSFESVWKNPLMSLSLVQVFKVITVRLEVFCLPLIQLKAQGDQEQHFRSSGCQIGATVESKFKTTPGVQEG